MINIGKLYVTSKGNTFLDNETLIENESVFGEGLIGEILSAGFELEHAAANSARDTQESAYMLLKAARLRFYTLLQTLIKEIEDYEYYSNVD